jgi:hypothetical protein
MNTFAHQFLIASYQKDFVWLRHCLRSLAKFSTGFLPPVVAVTTEDLPRLHELVAKIAIEFPGVKVAHPTVFDGPGFGRAQLAMMSGDVLCPDADYVWLLGSDCLAIRRFGPEAYCDADGLPYMLYNSWEFMAKHGSGALLWKAGVEEALGVDSTAEFMRRLPLAYPKRLFGVTRGIIRACHLVQAEDYVIDRVNRVRNFSESNVMGEVAWRSFRSSYHWINRDNETVPGGFDTPIIQHWSHGGLDRPRDWDKRTPRSVILETLGSL